MIEELVMLILLFKVILYVQFDFEAKYVLNNFFSTSCLRILTKRIVLLCGVKKNLEGLLRERSLLKLNLLRRAMMKSMKPAKMRMKKMLQEASRTVVTQPSGSMKFRMWEGTFKMVISYF